VPGLRHALCLAAVKVAGGDLRAVEVAIRPPVGTARARETMDTQDALELWSLVSPPQLRHRWWCGLQDGVVIEVRRGLTGTLETMDTPDSTGTLVTGQSIGGFARAVRSQDGVLIEVKYDRFLAETSRTRTLRKALGL
jgi:hypothetical protein